MSPNPSLRPASVQLPLDRELVLKVIPMPADCNANGDIFGGWVMAQVDLAGSVLPARHVKGRMATVAVNEFIFKQPVRVGDILSFFAEVTRIGTTSITVQVEVYAERFSRQREYVKVTQANLTYVAIGSDGRPRPVERDQGDADRCACPVLRMKAACPGGFFVGPDPLQTGAASYRYSSAHLRLLTCLSATVGT